MTEWIREIIEKIPGTGTSREVRGAVLITDAEYLKREFGDESVSAVSRYALEQGYKLDYSQIKPMAWYPIELRFVSLMSIKSVYNLEESDLRTMGSRAPSYSLITRLLLRYMVNVDALAANIQKYWNKNYNFGVLVAKNEPGTLYICIDDCPAPREILAYMEGYFASAIGMVVGRNNIIELKESRWYHETGDCLEFAMRYRE